MTTPNDIFANFKKEKVKIQDVGKYYTPSKPIETYTHLKGRDEEVKHILTTLTTAGQHCMIYGDRGIGKSSLALSTLKGGSDSKIFSKPFFVTRCDKKTKFKDIIQKPVIYLDEDYASQKIEITRKTGVGLNLLKLFRADIAAEEKLIIEKEDLTASKVCEAIQDLTGILLIDEFDVVDDSVKHEVAELIKQLSDIDCKLKILLVGIASDGASLIAAHQSVNRCLHEIKLTRIKNQYLYEIIAVGEDGLGIKFDDDVKDKIVEISNGFPYFTHLICKEAADVALSEAKCSIDKDILDRALKNAVINTEGQLKRAYDNAVTSSRTSVYPSILYAAAKFQDNKFTIQEWIAQIKEVTGVQYTNQAMSNYIGRFTRPDKGGIITKEARGVYKITDPRMSSYIRMVNSY